MKKVLKPYFSAAIAKNGSNVEKWSGQTSEKAIKDSAYMSKCGHKK